MTHPNMYNIVHMHNRRQRLLGAGEPEDAVVDSGAPASNNNPAAIGGTCPTQVLSSPLPPRQKFLGIFGFKTAISKDGSMIAIAAPGEMPTDQKRDYVIPAFVNSQGNIYTAMRDNNTSSLCPAYGKLTRLAKPTLSTPYAQGFGIGLAMTRGGSHVVAAVGGCYVKPGDLPPPCPLFPSPPSPSPPSADGALAEDGNPGAMQPPSPCEKLALNPWARTAYSKCPVQQTPLPEQQSEDPTTEMDVIWLYTRRTQRGTGYALNTAASKTLTLTAPLVGNQTIYPNLFFYTSPLEVFLSVSDGAGVIAANALIGFIGNDSVTIPVISASGVQVRRFTRVQ
jgi:hypothetical protein